MIYLYNLENVNDTKQIVHNCHYNPLDPIDGLGKTQDELALTGVFVDSIPDAQTPDFKQAILCYNPTTKTAFWDYQDRPLTPDEQITNLKSQNAQMILALVNGGLM